MNCPLKNIWLNYFLKNNDGWKLSNWHLSQVYSNPLFPANKVVLQWLGVLFGCYEGSSDWGKVDDAPWWNERERELYHHSTAASSCMPRPHGRHAPCCYGRVSVAHFFDKNAYDPKRNTTSALANLKLITEIGFYPECCSLWGCPDTVWPGPWRLNIARRLWILKWRWKFCSPTKALSECGVQYIFSSLEMTAYRWTYRLTTQAWIAHGY